MKIKPRGRADNIFNVMCTILRHSYNLLMAVVSFKTMRYIDFIAVDI